MTRPLQAHQLSAMTQQIKAGVPLAGLSIPPPKPKRNNEEFQLQAALISWWSGACRGFEVPEFLLWHTPNSAVYGGPKQARERMGAMLKRLGQRSGCPDLFLAVPRDGHDRNQGRSDNDCYANWLPTQHGLFLELKSKKGVLSPEQICFRAALIEQDYAFAEVRSLEAGIKAITDYLQ